MMKLAGALGGLVLLAIPAQAATEVGTLQCAIAPGIGLIVGSQKPLDCRYSSMDGKVVENYVGTVTRIGVDIGVTGESRMIWQVVAPTTDLGPGALAGTYAGPSAQATAGLGATANVLVGGSDRTISLQPVSVGAQSGLNVAAGIGAIRLEPAR